MTTYKTAEVAAVIGVHPNTVRLYEEWGLIPAAKRQKNGYRVFTAFHIQQFWLARTAFQIEVLQGGLRKKIVEVVKLSAQGNFDGAILLTREYVADLGKERDHAEEAICIVQHILSGDSPDTPAFLKRKETSDYLGISMDTLRNWEMNGLLTIKRKQNGYRVYSEQDIRRLKIIRSLRCANYSLEAILRMLQQLSKNPNTDIKLAPQVVFLDELTTGLDARARRGVWKSLKELKDGGLTIFLTSHFMDEVEALCDEICILQKGRAVFYGTVAQAKEKSGCENFEDAYLKLSGEGIE